MAERELGMRGYRPSSLTVAALVCAVTFVGSGCTDGGIEPESIDDKPAVADPALEFLVQPERAKQAEPPRGPIEPLPAPEPSSDEWRPRTYPERGDAPPHLEIVADGYTGPCSFGVAAHGLPAVDREAERIVSLEYENEQGPSDYDTSRALLVWRDFDDEVIRSEELYDGEKLEGRYEDAPAVTCARLRRSIEGIIPGLNEDLAAEPLATMPVLPVQIAYPNAGEPPLAKHGSQRPVELVYRHGELITRVRGLEILARSSHPGWQGPSYTMDAYNPNVLEVFGDRETGVAVVLRSYESASCMSDTQVYSGVTRLPEAAFDAIELRRKLPVEPNYY